LYILLIDKLLCFFFILHSYWNWKYIILIQDLFKFKVKRLVSLKICCKWWWESILEKVNYAFFIFFLKKLLFLNDIKKCVRCSVPYLHLGLTDWSLGHQNQGVIRPRYIIILNCDRPTYICCSNLLYSLASSSSRDGGEFGGGATCIGTLI